MVTRPTDDVTLLLHLVVLNRAASPFVLDKSNHRAAKTAPASFDTFSASDVRFSWEEWLSKGVNTFTKGDGLGAELQAAEVTYGSAQDDGSAAFIAELMERVDVQTLPVTERAERAPGLFLYARRFDYGHFKNTLQMGADREKFPLCAHFIDADQATVLRSLRQLHSVLEWVHLLKVRFHGHLDRATARTRSCEEVIAEVDEAERPRWEAAFRGFCVAWNDAWESVRRFGRLLSYLNALLRTNTKSHYVAFITIKKWILYRLCPNATDV